MQSIILIVVNQEQFNAQETEINKLYIAKQISPFFLLICWKIWFCKKIKTTIQTRKKKHCAIFKRMKPIDGYQSTSRETERLYKQILNFAFLSQIFNRDISRIPTKLQSISSAKIFPHLLCCFEWILKQSAPKKVRWVFSKCMFCWLIYIERKKQIMAKMA